MSLVVKFMCSQVCTNLSQQMSVFDWRRHLAFKNVSLRLISVIFIKYMRNPRWISRLLHRCQLIVFHCQWVDGTPPKPTSTDTLCQTLRRSFERLSFIRQSGIPWPRLVQLEFHLLCWLPQSRSALLRIWKACVTVLPTALSKQSQVRSLLRLIPPLPLLRLLVVLHYSTAIKSSVVNVWSTCWLIIDSRAYYDVCN